jgi:hypothetical protein
MAVMLKAQMNEVYLSTPASLLSNAALPAFIERLSKSGVAVEALIGEAAWGAPAGHANMLAQIARILAYNAEHPAAARFKSIHLDVEPWIGTGADLSWVTPLIASYEVARVALAAVGLHLSVDVAGSKVASLPLAERQALLASADKVVLMQYETSLANVLSRTDRFLNGLSTDHTGGVVVAVRAQDFAQPYQTAATIDGELSSDKGYLGWALYDYSAL